VLLFELVVIDSLALADPTPDEVQVTVNNQPPVANAGSLRSVYTNTVVTLNGSGTDPDNDLPLTFGWTQTGGPAVTLEHATAPGATFTAPDAPTVLTFTLVVTDALGLASTGSEVQVDVVDQGVTITRLQHGSGEVLDDMARERGILQGDDPFLESDQPNWALRPLSTVKVGRASTGTSSPMRHEEYAYGGT
jgi:hypothetical protein